MIDVDAAHSGVVRAENLKAPGRFSRPLNSYVKIQVGDFAKRTEIFKRSTDPSWNEEFTFIMAPTSVIQFRVKHEPFAFQRRILGSVEIDMSKLLTLGEDKKDVVLKLISAGEDNVPTDRGYIVVRIWKEDDVKANITALENARQVVKENLEGEKSATKSLGQVVSKLQVFAAILDEASKVHPYVSIVWKAAASMYKIVEKQIERDEQVIELMVSMDDAYTSIVDIKSIRDQTAHLKSAIRTVIDQTFECAMFIQEYAGRGFSKRALRDTFSANATDKIQQFTHKFVELKRALDTGVGFQTMLISSRMLEKVEAIATKQSLGSLQPAPMYPYGRLECLLGTRVEILAFITDWVTTSQSGTNVLWLHGVAGSGKSTLANTIANFFLGTNRLGAHLFFSRNAADSAPAFVIRTLAYQLGSFDPRIGHAISAAMDESPHVIRSPSLLQFQRLIAEPLSSIEILQYEGPVVIVIDALDECGSPEDREELLNVLGEELTKLPSVVRFIVTSRPEYDIQNRFHSGDGITSLEVKVTSVDTQNDIETFIRHRLNGVRERNKLLRLADDWPGHRRIEALVQRASGLFIWASTACKFIDTHDPEGRLGIVLQNDISSDAKSALDGLYGTALESAGSWNDVGFGADFQAVIGTLLVARDRLSASALDNLLEGQRPSLHAISRLGCLLYMNSVIRILHPSFADFLSNMERCKSKDWFIDVADHNLRVASCCIGRLSSFLKRNMCDLKLSERPSHSDLPEDVTYACMFWVEHVCMVADPSAIEDKLVAFLFSHLLHWFEAVSILHKSAEAIGILQRLLLWVKTAIPDNSDLHALVYDGHRFAQAFVNTMEEHPLLIYETALPFTPVETLIYRTFHDKREFPWLSVGFETSWSPMVCVHEHKQVIHSLAFSPDGRQIASLSGEGIRLRDTLTGADIISRIPMSSGKGAGSVAFSPTGTHIASSWRAAPDSDDWEVCLWNASSRGKALGPFVAGLVTEPGLSSAMFSQCSMIFSPDGTTVATCNPAGKIYLWDAASGTELFGPLNDSGPAARADLLAFYPDGSRIVSTSYSCLYVWDLISGDQIIGSLSAHPFGEKVNSIIVSLDGTRIFSLASCVLRVWDANSGALILSKTLFVGDFRYNRAAAFSPDATRVALATYSGCIFIYDLTSGAQIFSLNKQIAPQGLYSLIFSADGKMIAAAFDSRTVRVYDIPMVPDIEPASQDDIYQSLNLIASSSNGNYVAFTAQSTQGPAIHVLDLSSGREVLQPILDADLSPVQKLKVKNVKFSADGSRIIYVSEDRSIRSAELPSAEYPTDVTVFRPSHLRPSLMSISPDGNRIVISDCASVWHDGYAAVEIWDAIESVRILGPLRGPQAQNRSMAFSPDGTRILSLGSVLCVWDAMTGGIIFEIAGDTLFRAGYSQNGTSIIAHGLEDDIIQLDAASGNQTSSYKSFPRVPQSNHLERFAIDKTDYWVKDVETSGRICQLPSTLRDCNGTISSNTSITIDTNGGLIVMHFPALMHRA